MRCDARFIGLACLLVLALAVHPAAAQASGWQRFIDAFVPASVREFFGGSPREPSEAALKILSKAQVLELEKPVEGDVGAGDNDILRMKFPPNGTDFPNILLTLTVENQDGDADIYCIPEYLFEISGKAPTRRFSVWKSDHGQGADHIFISRSHELYEDSKFGLQGDGKTAEGVSFVCSVTGFAAAGSDYLLEVDVDYTERQLVGKEMKAMEEIFDQCCLGSPTSCQPWKGTKTEDDEISMDFCHIPGSICNSAGNLIRLDLSSLEMDCQFPTAAIAKLEKLEKLDLSNNQIKGNIAKILESLRMKTESLQFVNLKENKVEGSISEEVKGKTPICELTHKGSLAFISLADNAITGELPACLFDETSTLKELSLDGNSLSGGLPDISPKSGLQALRLVDTGLTGTIPEALGDLEKLIVLNLGSNALEGSIPENLGSAETLISVNLSDNELSGTIPGAMASGMHLKYVRLSGNAFEEFGEEWYTPGWLDMSKLHIVDVRNNTIAGKFPSALVSAPLLQVLGLSNNTMSGPLPDEPGMLPRAVVLLLADNSFSGPIPEALSDSGFFNKPLRQYLPKLDLSKNELTGEIPEFLKAGNVHEFLWEQIRLGGNNFNLPCPLAIDLVHIKDLACENGESPVDDTEVVVSTVPGFDDDEFFDAFPPQAEPTSEDAGVVEPAEEPAVEDIEFTEAELASADGDDRDAALLVKSKRGRGIPLGTLATEADPETSVSTSTPKTKTASGNLFIVIGVCFVVALAVSVVVAVVIRRQQQRKKSDVVSDVVAMDLEMQNAPEPDDGDGVQMLDGVKSSARL